LKLEEPLARDRFTVLLVPRRPDVRSESDAVEEAIPPHRRRPSKYLVHGDATFRYLIRQSQERPPTRELD